MRISWSSYFVTLALCSFLLSLITPLYPINQLTQTLTQIAWKPEATNYLKAAQLYESVDKIKSMQELQLAAITAATTDQVQKVQNFTTSINAQSTNLKAQLAYWQQITQIHPAYKDAWSQARYFTDQLGDCNKIKNFNQIIKTLDPNASLTVLENCGED